MSTAMAMTALICGAGGLFGLAYDSWRLYCDVARTVNRSRQPLDANGVAAVLNCSLVRVYLALRLLRHYKGVDFCLAADSEEADYLRTVQEPIDAPVYPSPVRTARAQ